MTINAQTFLIFYDGGDGNDVVLMKVVTLPPTIVFVDDNWTSVPSGNDADGLAGGTLGNGTAVGYDQFDTIQEAINAVAIGGEIRVYGGTYTEALIINKSLALRAEDFLLSGTAGDTLADTIVDPSVLTPVIIEASVSGVEIAGLTVEGDTTDSYGILATHPINTLTGLEIHHNAVRNLFRRGIQSDTYLAEFDIHHNIVSNVAGDPAAIAIFNFGGGGLPGTAEIHNNTVTGSTVGIGGQQSAGMQVHDNNITMIADGIGIQDSNPGTGSPPPIVRPKRLRTISSAEATSTARAWSSSIRRWTCCSKTTTSRRQASASALLGRSRRASSRSITTRSWPTTSVSGSRPTPWASMASRMLRL